jgi:hypothetical protein
MHSSTAKKSVLCDVAELRVYMQLLVSRSIGSKLLGWTNSVVIAAGITSRAIQSVRVAVFRAENGRVYYWQPILHEAG